MGPRHVSLLTTSGRVLLVPITATEHAYTQNEDEKEDEEDRPVTQEQKAFAELESRLADAKRKDEEARVRLDEEEVVRVIVFYSQSEPRDLMSRSAVLLGSLLPVLRSHAA